jgi:crossover junction endodeoxyribonuclease RuvC
MVRIIGIDPGTAIVGWGVIDHDEQKHTTQVVAYGHIETNSDRPASERLFDIGTNIKTLLDKYQPDEAAVEELFYFKNAKTVISVAQARGVVIYVLHSHMTPTAEYTPLQIKQSLTGYGRAQKKQMQEMIKNMLQLKKIPTPDDTADALAVAMCHCHSRRHVAIINHQIS